MPFGDYKPHIIMKKVQTRHKKGETVRHLKQKMEMELETVKVQHAADKAELQRFQTNEKKRLAAVKRAREAKKGAKKTNVKK